MLQFDHGQEEFNYVLNLEKEVSNVRKDLKNKEEIKEVDYNDLYPCGSRPGIFYGLPKVYKPVIGRCPSLRPVLSAINAPYKLAIFLAPLLKSLTSNDYTINDSFSFAEEVSSFDCAYYLTSFDIELLYANIQLEQTTKICVDKFFKTKIIKNNLTKESFRSLLEMGTLDSFDEKHYKQKDRVAMDSPLVPTLDNAFL